MQLPPTWQFLGGMWWVLHIVAIALVFYLGYIIGQGSAESRKDGNPGTGEDEDESPRP